MRILVTFAVEAEFAPWRKLREFKKSPPTNSPTSQSRSAFKGTFGDNDIEVLLTGIGYAACGKTLAKNLFRHDGMLDLVISSGLSGALKEGLKPGDVIAPLKVRTLRNDANADSHTVYRERAMQQGALPIETLITVDRIVPTAAEKARLAFFGEAVDMESAIIMSHFTAATVPVVTIRAISDSSDEDLPIDFDRCLTPQGAIKPMSLVNAIVRRPGNLPNLVRFGRQSNQAAKKLAGFLDKFIAALLVAREKVATL
jgi:adenosylhomocysteine nucleosidase